MSTENVLVLRRSDEMKKREKPDIGYFQKLWRSRIKDIIGYFRRTDHSVMSIKEQIELWKICEKVVKKYNLEQYFMLSPCTKSHYKFFLKFIQQFPKNVSIFDGACGIGILAICLKKLGYDNYYGADIAEKYIQAGKYLFRKFNIERSLFHENLAKTHFENEFFDIVCILDASYFNIFDMEPIVKEVYRILKRNGWFVMDVLQQRTGHWLIYSQANMLNYLKDFTQIEFRSLPKTPSKFVVVARK